MREGGGGKLSKKGIYLCEQKFCLLGFVLVFISLISTIKNLFEEFSICLYTYVYYSLCQKNGSFGVYSLMYSICLSLSTQVAEGTVFRKLCV